MQRHTARLEADDSHDTWALLYGLASMASFVAACLGYRTRALSLPCALLVLLASVVALGLCRRHLDSQRRTRTPCEKVDATTSLSRPLLPARSTIAPPVESCLFTWALSPSGSIRPSPPISASSSTRRSPRCDRTTEPSWLTDLVETCHDPERSADQERRDDDDGASRWQHSPSQSIEARRRHPRAPALPRRGSPPLPRRGNA